MWLIYLIESFIWQPNPPPPSRLRSIIEAYLATTVLLFVIVSSLLVAIEACPLTSNFITQVVSIARPEAAKVIPDNQLSPPDPLSRSTGKNL